MPAVSATAPGKIILFGEHAVVYGRPAIAAPVQQIQARAVVTALPRGAPGQVQIVAKDVGLDCDAGDLDRSHPLVQAIQATARRLGAGPLPAIRLQVSSTIPIAAGLGSGAAVTVAISRALSAFLGHPLPDEDISAIAYQVDQHYHGTPSGIDNTVVAYAQPIWYARGQPFERVQVRESFTIVIGNTGVASLTRAAVGDVRSRWQADPGPYERIFDEIGSITMEARRAIEGGAPGSLGPLMARNQALLRTLDVSSPGLERLVEAAARAGADGAKLCGAGRGGNMIALVDPQNAGAVAEALWQAGASHTIITTIR
jgi:mevalonate kinase